MDEIVPEPWDTLWAVSRADERHFAAGIDLRATDRARLAREWRGSLGLYNLLLLTADGAVVWEDACDINLNERFDPPLAWTMAWPLDSPPRDTWIRLTREEAVFEVRRYVEAQVNMLVLVPKAKPPPSNR